MCGRARPHFLLLLMCVLCAAAAARAVGASLPRVCAAAVRTGPKLYVLLHRVLGLRLADERPANSLNIEHVILLRWSEIQNIGAAIGMDGGDDRSCRAPAEPESKALLCSTRARLSSRCCWLGPRTGAGPSRRPPGCPTATARRPLRRRSRNTRSTAALSAKARPAMAQRALDWRSC